MSRHAAVLGRLVGATILSIALFLCTTHSAEAQEQAPSSDRAPRVDVVTDGVFGSFQPEARVRIDRPGYVALFEVEPGVGATMLYPEDPSEPERLDAGVHALRLNGIAAANRRLLMEWHLGWAFAQRPNVVPRNHLVAVVSEEPLDVSELLSRRIFHYSRNLADADEVTHALLATVTNRMSDDAWNAARTSYDKHRDPQLLATFDVWLDAPFYPLARELALTGFPPVERVGFRFSCGGAEFLATGGAFSGRTAHDLPPCRHAQLDGRTLADMNGQDRQASDHDAARTASREAADGEADAADVEAEVRSRQPLPEEVRETLRRVADAAEGRSSGREVETLRRLESAGAAMSARGVDVDATRLRALRVRAEVRARIRARIRRLARHARIDVSGDGRIELSGMDRPGGFGGSPGPGARRGSSTIHGSGSGSAVNGSDPRVGVPTGQDVGRRVRPVQRSDRPRDRSRSSGDG